MKKICAIVCAFVILLGCLPVSVFATSENEVVNVWNGSIANGFEGGTGTKTDPYIIKSGEQLAYLAKSVNNGNTYAGIYFSLVNNIYLNDIKSEITKGSDVLFYNNWVPIGTTSHPFSGNFLGNDYSIIGLVCSKTTNYSGLFGVTNCASIERLHIKNSYIAGSNYVGSFIGYISKVGAGDGIYHCSSNALVCGTDYVGGLTGYHAGGYLYMSSFEGIVDGGRYVGGLTGYLSMATIDYCYNLGNVYGKQYCGGLAGYNPSSKIQFSYNASEVQGGYAIVGESNYSHNTCYYDKSKATGTTGIALTPSEMKSASSYKSFDFANCWNINPIINDGLPYLRENGTGNRNNRYGYIGFSDTKNRLEYPIYERDNFANQLRIWAGNSQYSASFSNWISQGHSYAELLDMTIDIPVMGNDGIVYSVNGTTTVKDLMAYIIFADIAQDYLLEALDSARNSIQNNKATDAYQDFFKVIKNFQSQYYYFQNNLNGENDFQQTLYSLLLAKTILTVVDNSGIKDVKYAFDLYKGSVSESPQYYDDLYYYVMSGGDTSYLNSSHASTMKGLGLVVKDSKQAIKITKSGLSSGDAVSYITLGLDNLSYFADTYEWDYRDKIKTAKEAWAWADTTIGYAKAITTYSWAGTLSSSWKLANAYIDEVKKVYTNAESTDAGWYALTYFYLMGNNKNLFNALIDQDTGSAEFGIDRIAQYGVPYNEKDIIEKSIVSYWNKKAYLTYSYTPSEKMRLYLWNASNIANTVMEMNIEEYCEMMLQYILAEINFQNGITGINRTLTATANDNSLGSVSGSGQYSIGSEVTLSATPYNNVNFSGWKDIASNRIVSTNRFYTFTLNNDTRIQAIFTAGNARCAQSPVITSQPESVIVGKGQSAELLNINAQSPDGGKIKVAWYRNAIDRNIGGVFVANGTTLQPDSSEVGTYYYYAVVTNELTDYIGSNEVITTASAYSNPVKVTVNEPIVIGLSIEALPNKQSYKTDEPLDPSGMVVWLHYSDGISLPIDDYSLEYDFSEIGRQKVVVLMLNYWDSFYVDVSCRHEFGDWIVDNFATPDSVGYRHHICTVCGNVETEEIPQVTILRFAGASLTLQNNLKVKFVVQKDLFENYGYKNPYAVFEMNGESITVSDYTVSGEYYIFSFSNIAPDKMSDTITATLHAKYGGVEYISAELKYSIAQYCYSMLGKDTTTDKLRTLLVDLLHYGAASQIYTGHNAESLADAFLTDEQLAWGTETDPELTSVTDANHNIINSPSVIWKGVSLNLKDSITMQFVFSSENVDGITVKVEGQNGNVINEITSDDFVTSGGYYVAKFKGLTAGQMSETVYVTAYSGKNAISNTVAYSIESYAYSKQNDTDTNLATMVKSMMKYGNAAYAYAH